MILVSVLLLVTSVCVVFSLERTKKRRRPPNLVMVESNSKPSTASSIYADSPCDLDKGQVRNPRSSNSNSVDFKNFQREDRLGKGGFGTVYKCFVPPNSLVKYAVKHIQLTVSKTDFFISSTRFLFVCHFGKED